MAVVLEVKKVCALSATPMNNHACEDTRSETCGQSRRTPFHLTSSIISKVHLY